MQAIESALSQATESKEEVQAKFIMTIAEDNDGNRVILATEQNGQPMTMGKIREFLQWGLNKVGDDILAVFVSKHVDKILSQTIKPNGFRSGKVFDFLRRK